MKTTRSVRTLSPSALSLLALSLSKGSNGLLRAAVFTALLAIVPCSAFADGGPMPKPYRRPAALQQSAQGLPSTVTGRLLAMQTALKASLTALREYNGQGIPGSQEYIRETLEYGGHLARARDDLATALQAADAALAFVREHPEANQLAKTPAAADEPKLPALPKIPPPETYTNPISLVKAVDALDVALTALANPTAAQPAFGELGGHRAKLLAAIALAGADFSAADAYYKNVRGGRTGVIPAGTIPTDVKPDPQYGPTARPYLAQAQLLLKSESGILTNPNPNVTTDRIQGGYVSKVAGHLQRATDNLTAALAYLDSHPEADALASGPAAPETSATRRAKLPPGEPRFNFGGPTGPPDPLQYKALNYRTISSLNTIVGWLLNNPAPDYHGPVLGDLGGYRAKILDDLGRALADTLAGIDFVTANGPPADASPVTKPAAP